MHQFFLIFTTICHHINHYLSSYSSVDLICFLLCMIFHKSPWWPVWTFCAQTLFNFRMRLLKIKLGNKMIKKNLLPIKRFLKYFMAHQYMSKIIYGPCENPQVPLPLLHTSHLWWCIISYLCMRHLRSLI